MEPVLTFNPVVVAGFVFSIAVDILFPLVLALILWRRTQVSWKYFAYGALVFFVAQILIRIPLLSILGPALQPVLAGNLGLQIIYLALLALTAGIFEEVGRWLGYRFLITKERTWRVGVMYGLGHGGIESILLIGASAISSLALYLALTVQHTQIPLPDAVLASLRDLTPLVAVLGGVERIFTVLFHVAASLLVLQAFSRHNIRWLWYAIGYHALVDFVVPGINAFLHNIYLAEGVNALFGLVSIWLILRLRQGPEQFTPAAVVQPEARLQL